VEWPFGGMVGSVEKYFGSLANRQKWM